MAALDYIPPYVPPSDTIHAESIDAVQSGSPLYVPHLFLHLVISCYNAPP